MSNKIRFKVIIIGVLLVSIISVSLFSCKRKPKDVALEPLMTKVQDEVVNTIVDKGSERIEELESELNKYKTKEYKEELRRLKLEKLQNPEIINSELEGVGRLVVYTGKATYSNTFNESKFLRPKKITVDLAYRFGISVDLKNIVVSEFIEDVVVLQIHRDQLKIEYVELDEESIKILEEVKLLAKEFTKGDINEILAIGKSTTTSRIAANKGIYDKALESLKNNVEEMVLSLGFRKIIFEVV